MNVTRPFLVSTLFVAVILANGGERTKAGGFGHRPSLGKPIEGLNFDQLKLFRDGKEVFAEEEDAADGLGPIFNNTGCAVCHSVPVVGGSSPINETRAGRLQGGRFVELPGGSLFQDQGISANCAETVPSDANVKELRQTQPLFGLGLIEAIPDVQIQIYAAQQARRYPEQAGRINIVRDAPTGALRVGRFGWKDQQATLLAFAGDAYLNEMGITSPHFPTENAPNGDLAKLRACDTVPDPEDDGADVVAFANFMRLLAPPPREDSRNGSPGGGRHDDRDRDGGRGHGPQGADRDRFGGPPVADRGEMLLERVGCAVCHHSGFTAVSAIQVIGGERVNAFSDLLLHDVGTGDGIVQGGASGNEFRTPPLWGISDSAPYLHDGSAPTLRDAIGRHANQGAASRQRFLDLPLAEQEALLKFLDSI